MRAAVIGEQARNFGDGLNGADFVVREHDAGKDRLGAEGTLKFGKVQVAGGVAANVGDVEAEFFKKLGGMEARVMFDSRTDDVVAGACTPERIGDAEQSGVDALGTAAGEKDFGGTCADDCRDAGAGAIDGLLGFTAKRIEAAGVAEDAIKERQHGVARGGVKARGGGVVEIDHRVRGS